MAHAQPLSQNVLDVIARQIGDRLPPASLTPVPPGGALSIAENFPVWTLGLTATTRPDEPFRSLVTNTGNWHHQVHSTTGEHLMGRSTPNGPNPEDWHVLSVSRSSRIATKIDQAIEWIDNNVTGDPLARLLEIPSYYLLAFWLESSTIDQIIIVDMPPKYTRLQYKHVYTAKEFLETLAQEPHAQGVPQP
jgi:hypothetical protein